MTLTDLLTLASAVWYWSYVLTSSDGPFQAFAWIREHVSHGRQTRVSTAADIKGNLIFPNGELIKNGLLDCIICTAIWVGIVFTLAPHGWLTDASAVAGIGLWLHSYTGWKSYG